MPEAQNPKPKANPEASATSLWLPVLAYMSLIFALSSVSHPPSLPNGSDKLLHGLLYSGLGAVFARAMAGGWRRVMLTQVLAALCFGALYGVSDEVHQYFNPPRNVEALDVLADTLGAAAGGFVLYACGIIRGRDGV